MSYETFVRAFLGAIERGELEGNEERWYQPNAVQVEYPNKLNPAGATRNLSDLRAAAAKGRSIIAQQGFEIVSFLEQGNRIAMEVIFCAKFKIDVLGLPAGKVMTSRFGVFLTMVAGRIAEHRTYDCFDPWPDAA